MKTRTVSIPHEHGGYVTLAAAAVAAVAMARAPLMALGFAVVATAAFFLRAPLEQLTVDRPARWDRLALVALGTLAVAVSLLMGRHRRGVALLAVATGVAIIGTSLWARLHRSHRHALFELAGMAMLGAAGGAMAFAGGVPLRASTVVGVALGLHAALAVPLVRTELRPGERRLAGRADAAAIAAIAIGAGSLATLGAPWSALALSPRAAQLGLRRAGRLGGLRPLWVGARETLELALVVAILLLTLR